MNPIARRYVRLVDGMNYGIGRVMMYFIFVMMGILMYSSVSKVLDTPALWTLETAQFAMVAYYMLGGPYSIQMGSNVRMDLFYHDWSARRKAGFDAFTIFFLIFYLGVLLWGGIDSLAYSLGHFQGTPFQFFGSFFNALFTGGIAEAGEVLGRPERSPTAWRPYLWPVKLCMVVGITLMLLQAVSEFLKDVARLRGAEV